MIYSTTLGLPGEFTEQYTVDAQTDLDHFFRQAMSSYVASPIVPTARHTTKRHFPIQGTRNVLACILCDESQ